MNALLDAGVDDGKAPIQEALEWLLDREISVAGDWRQNAMIDPSTPDITSRGIRALLAAGLDPREAPVRRAAGYLLREQEEDGSWPGRWGANHIYGTGLSLRALGELAAAATRDRSDALARALRRGRSWLLRVQNGDGGWGESLRSYEDPTATGAGTAPRPRRPGQCWA